MLESTFVKDILRPELKRRFPDCWVFKQDPLQLQGVPDLLILYKGRWAMLETKRAKTAERQMNQTYYVRLFNELSFAAFISPENYLRVLADMERVLKTDGV